jgi:hypothetical protein
LVERDEARTRDRNTENPPPKALVPTTLRSARLGP